MSVINLPLAPPATGATFLTAPALIPVGGRIKELANDLVFRDVDGTIITVKKGYRTDGESGPQLIKDLIITENNLREWPAWLHDPLYQAGLFKDYADAVYARALLALPISRITEWELEHAVILFGASSYAADQKDLEEKTAALEHLIIQLPKAA